MDNLNFDLNFDFSKPHIHKSAQIEQSKLTYDFYSAEFDKLISEYQNKQD